MTRYILSIDQGTTSSRAIVFNHEATVVSMAQQEHQQIFPQAGWVEQDPMEIWNNTSEVIGQALGKAHLTRHDIAAVGITNQRETTILWDKNTGQPVCNAIVWQDTRSQEIADRVAQDGGVNRFREQTGLPLGSYFSATKIAWILENVPGVRERALAGEIYAGTIDTWLLWNLTGGPNGGIHATDVSNASRTLLMDLRTLDWNEELLAAFDIPRSLLPNIRPSMSEFGIAAGESLLRGCRITGILGDQHASLFGHGAFETGQAKNTYGTGCFVFVNTGTSPVSSQHGLLTTVAYQREGEPAHYALEGSIAVTGSLIQWLRDNLGILTDASEAEALARSVEDNGGVYVVPAFSGLFAPHWRPDARGVIVGLTRFVRKEHIVRASLEATAFQVDDVLTAVIHDTPSPLTSLSVDGGMTKNSLLMQTQADLLGIPVSVSGITETTALGAAYAAGLTVGYWSSLEELAGHRSVSATFEPTWTEDHRASRRAEWERALQRSLNWAD